jgi:DNA-binding response OmpR family regulator
MTVRVLYVEDQLDDVFIVERAIAAARLDVVLYHAPDGEVALQRIAGEGQYSNRKTFPFPDLLLLDLELRLKTGFDVLEAVRRIPCAWQLPVILYSSLLSDKDVARGLQLGALASVRKTSQCNDLLAHLDKFARQQSEQWLVATAGQLSSFVDPATGWVLAALEIQFFEESETILKKPWALRSQKLSYTQVRHGKMRLARLRLLSYVSVESETLKAGRDTEGKTGKNRESSGHAGEEDVSEHKNLLKFI